MVDPKAPARPAEPGMLASVAVLAPPQVQTSAARVESVSCNEITSGS
jgi:hypothetical protein